MTPISRLPAFSHPALGNALLDDTRRLGRIAAALALPLLGYFIWQDLAVLRIPRFIPARLIVVCLFALSGLVLSLPEAPSRLAQGLHGLSLFALLAMSCHIYYVAVVAYPTEARHAAMASNTLSLNYVAALLVAGGLKRWLPLLTGPPLAALPLALLAAGRLDSLAASGLSNPLMAYLIASILALVQDREWRSEQEHRALSELRRQQLETLLEATTESVFLMDLDGRVVFCNEILARRMGMEKAELLGQLIYDFLPAEVAERRRACVAEAARSGKPFRFEDRQGALWIDQVIHPVVEKDGTTRYMAVYGKDVTAERLREEELVHQALHDPLTGLLNRRSLQDRLVQAIGRASRGYPSCLLYIDLDHFKEVNDQLGHALGDEVLVEVARGLAKGGREHDTAFRVGGDEFAILVEGADLTDAHGAAERIRLLIEGRRLGSPTLERCVTLSIGVAPITGDDSVAGTIERADVAMYRAKESGRNRVVEAELRDADRGSAASS
jgi:diguanylate cyclase (GGDEF)-like protein/PAS domain S-box-containing protein